MYQHIAQNGICIFGFIFETVGNSVPIPSQNLCNDFYETQINTKIEILKTKNLKIC